MGAKRLDSPLRRPEFPTRSARSEFRGPVARPNCRLQEADGNVVGVALPVRRHLPASDEVSKTIDAPESVDLFFVCHAGQPELLSPPRVCATGAMARKALHALRAEPMAQASPLLPGDTCTGRRAWRRDPRTATSWTKPRFRYSLERFFRLARRDRPGRSRSRGPRVLRGGTRCKNQLATRPAPQSSPQAPGPH